jgi:hypothetical protein
VIMATRTIGFFEFDIFFGGGCWKCSRSLGMEVRRMHKLSNGVGTWYSVHRPKWFAPVTYELSANSQKVA